MGIAQRSALIVLGLRHALRLDSVVVVMDAVVLQKRDAETRASAKSPGCVNGRGKFASLIGQAAP